MEYVSDPKLSCWGNFIMALHGFASRNPKSNVSQTKISNEFGWISCTWIRTYICIYPWYLLRLLVWVFLSSTVHTYIYIYINIHTYVYGYTYIYIYIHMYISYIYFCLFFVSLWTSYPRRYFDEAVVPLRIWPKYIVKKCKRIV